jgi:hypothetical protein
VSAEHPNSTRDGGDVIELRATALIHKSEAIRELARQLSAAKCDQQPSQWIHACMSPARRKYAHLLPEEALCLDEAVSAITEPARTPMVAGLYHVADDPPASHTHIVQG